uniref:Uncharacterized protein n=1 Tax=Rhizophora mucronata TaxID=61149 RepID=A0A2P2J3H1_RHIMU
METRNLIWVLGNLMYMYYIFFFLSFILFVFYFFIETRSKTK